MSTSCVLDSPGVMGPYWRQPILYPVEVNKVAWSVIEVHEPEWREVWMEVVCTDQNRVRERWACAPNEKGGYRLPAFWNHTVLLFTPGGDILCYDWSDSSIYIIRPLDPPAVNTPVFMGSCDPWNPMGFRPEIGSGHGFPP